MNCAPYFFKFPASWHLSQLLRLPAALADRLLLISKVCRVYFFSQHFVGLSAINLPSQLMYSPCHLRRIVICSPNHHRTLYCWMTAVFVSSPRLLFGTLVPSLHSSFREITFSSVPRLFFKAPDTSTHLYSIIYALRRPHEYSLRVCCLAVCIHKNEMYVIVLLSFETQCINLNRTYNYPRSHGGEHFGL